MRPETEVLRRAYADEAVQELMINADDSAYVEKQGGVLEKLPAAAGAEVAAEFLGALVGPGWKLDVARPFADLTAVDGARVNILIPPLVERGMAVTIRKRPKSRPDLMALVENGTLSQGCAEFLNFATFYGKNILVAGGTSSGKTTLLNALAMRAAEEDRILVLEDSQELRLPHPHTLYLKTRLRDRDGNPDVTLHELVKNALRMRPDRIIVGEVRGVEAADMLNAMNVGHDGVLTTLHANSAREAIQRLETLVLLSGLNLPLRALRQNIVSAIDLIVVMSRFQDGSRRVIQVAEAAGMEEDTVLMSDTFLADLQHTAQGTTYRLLPTGVVPKFYDQLRRQGVDCPTDFFKRDA